MIMMVCCMILLVLFLLLYDKFYSIDTMYLKWVLLFERYLYLMGTYNQGEGVACDDGTWYYYFDGDL